MTFAASVFFASSSTALNPESKAKLDDFASKLMSIQLEVVVVVGHADSSRAAGAAMALSIRRAEAVKAYLTSRGIEYSRVYTEGKGRIQPIADNKTPAGRARNNRVEIEIVGTRTDDVAVVAPWKANPIVPVLFATNRTRTGSNTAFYFYGNEQTITPDRNNLQRGVAVVKVPPKRKRGEIVRPPWVSVVFEKIATGAGFNPPNPGSIGGYDTSTQFTFEGKIEELTAPAFQIKLNDAIGSSKGKTAVLYVHGYANDFADGAFRAAQFAYDLSTEDYDIVPILFSWPSDPGIAGMDYATARNRSESSGYDLARFLDEIASKTDIAKIHIIAHSLGAEVLGHALMKMAANDQIQTALPGQARTPRFRQIVFAAPDITPTIFEDLIEPALKNQLKISSYGTSKDLALWFSEVKSKSARLGRNSGQGVPLKSIDTIDISSEVVTRLAHSTWAEAPRVLDDLRQVLCAETAPATRGLLSRRELDGVIWSLPAKVKLASCPIKSPK
ncbi:alpha/beta hydrolase [Duganella sp. HH105]|uniref:alpha/beta hydrolase n=1 Tax=Duganella sp. HH105 TaxID=1781067 RepID=UPI0008FFEFC2|nr:alpha/beta hydrolase [Duganella sp. HH105]